MFCVLSLAPDTATPRSATRDADVAAAKKQVKAKDCFPLLDALGISHANASQKERQLVIDRAKVAAALVNRFTSIPRSIRDKVKKPLAKYVATLETQNLLPETAELGARLETMPQSQDADANRVRSAIVARARGNHDDDAEVAAAVAAKEKVLAEQAAAKAEKNAQTTNARIASVKQWKLDRVNAKNDSGRAQYVRIKRWLKVTEENGDALPKSVELRAYLKSEQLKQDGDLMTLCHRVLWPTDGDKAVEKGPVGKDTRKTITAWLQSKSIYVLVKDPTTADLQVLAKDVARYCYLKEGSVGHDESCGGAPAKLRAAVLSAPPDDGEMFRLSRKFSELKDKYTERKKMAAKALTSESSSSMDISPPAAEGFAAHAPTPATAKKRGRPLVTSTPASAAPGDENRPIKPWQLTDMYSVIQKKASHLNQVAGGRVSVTVIVTVSESSQAGQTHRTSVVGEDSKESIGRSLAAAYKLHKAASAADGGASYRAKKNCSGFTVQTSSEFMAQLAEKESRKKKARVHGRHHQHRECGVGPETPATYCRWNA